MLWILFSFVVVIDVGGGAKFFGRRTEDESLPSGLQAVHAGSLPAVIGGRENDRKRKVSLEKTCRYVMASCRGSAVMVVGDDASHHECDESEFAVPQR